MNGFYRHILAESWKLCRTHLFLWPLAFFASLVGVAGTHRIFFDITSADAVARLSQWSDQMDFITGTFIGWSTSFEQIPFDSVRFINLIPLASFILYLIVIIMLAIVITSSHGGLIYALAQLQDKRRTGFLTSFRVGLDKFWSLFGINLVYRLIYLVIVSLLIAPILFSVPTAPPFYRLLLLVFVYLILIPLIIILDLIARYSLMYLMLHNQTIREAVWNGWLLFVTHWMISIETSLLIITGLIIAFLLIVVLALPLLLLLFTMFAAMVSFSPTALNIFFVTAMVALVLIIGIFITVFTALQMSIWVGVFKRITTGQHHSKIHRLVSHLPWLHRHLGR